jgi:hypothetical protein
MTNHENHLDEQFTRLFQSTLTLPEDRVRILWDRLSSQLETEAESHAWATFGRVMTGLITLWAPTQKWTTHPQLYRVITAG